MIDFFNFREISRFDGLCTCIMTAIGPLRGVSTVKNSVSLFALVSILAGFGFSRASAQSGVPLVTDRDRTEIQELVSHYARALSSCAAEDYADLFAPMTGSFASSIR